jgi:hypothetical protein
MTKDSAGETGDRHDDVHSRVKAVTTMIRERAGPA